MRLFLLLSLLPLLLPAPAHAADPGDACTAAQADTWIVSDSDPNIQIGCDGTQWRILQKIDESGAATSRIKQVITFGNDTAACDSDNEGTVRYTSGDIEWCDGTSWQSLTSGADGDWTISGSDIYRETGEVLIGTQIPAGDGYTALKIVGVNKDIKVYAFSNDVGNKPDIDLYKARGTEAAPADVSVGNVAGSLRFNIFHSSNWMAPARIEAVVDTASSLALAFRTGTHSSPSERMRITSTGNIGIGTADPKATLDVAGGIKVGSATTCNGDAEGTVRYNSTTSCLDFCNGTEWMKTCGLSGLCPSSGLVANWKFDETSGTTASDSAGSNDGTLTNMDPNTDWVSGKVGNALDFDGADDVVTLGNPAALTDMVQLSICAWIKWRSLPISDPRIYVKADASSSNGVRFSLDDRRSLFFLRGWSSGDGEWRTGDDSITPDGTWRHLCVTYHGSSTANDAAFYIDGSASAATEITAPSGSLDSDAAYNAIIGNRPDLARPLDGVLDDLRIYNRVLTPAEISTLYGSGTGCL